MSKIIGSILIILGLIDYLTSFLQCSSVGYTLFGLVPSLDSIGAVRGCSMLTVFILIILGLGLFFWKTNESLFESKKNKK